MEQDRSGPGREGEHVAARGMLGELQLGDHVCAFVDGMEDGLDVMAQTVTAALDAGEKAMVFTASLLPAAVLAGLEARGVAVTQARTSGQVQLLPAKEAYLPTGRLEPARMLDSLTGHIEQATAAGFAGLRLVGDMSWALDEPVGGEHLAGCEAQVTQLYMAGHALGVCLYDQRAFSRDLLRQAARAHPATVNTAAGAGGEPLLRIRRTTAPYGLRLIGECDLSNRQALASALDAVADQQPDRTVAIHLDLAGLRFADAAAAALLYRMALKAPAGVRISAPQQTVERILDRCGVLQMPEMRLTRAADPAAGSTDGSGTDMAA
jgi:anti-anti-sigma factor